MRYDYGSTEVDPNDYAALDLQRQAAAGSPFHSWTQNMAQYGSMFAPTPDEEEQRRQLEADRQANYLAQFNASQKQPTLEEQLADPNSDAWQTVPDTSQKPQQGAINVGDVGQTQAPKFTLNTMFQPTKRVLSPETQQAVDKQAMLKHTINSTDAKLNAFRALPDDVQALVINRADLFGGDVPGVGHLNAPAPQPGTKAELHANDKAASLSAGPDNIFGAKSGSDLQTSQALTMSKDPSTSRTLIGSLLLKKKSPPPPSNNDAGTSAPAQGIEMSIAPPSKAKPIEQMSLSELNQLDPKTLDPYDKQRAAKRWNELNGRP